MLDSERIYTIFRNTLAVILAVVAVFMIGRDMVAFETCLGMSMDSGHVSNGIVVCEQHFAMGFPAK